MEVSTPRSDRIELPERDTLLVLGLLENPPPPSSKLIGAAKAWTDNQKMVCKLWGYCPA